jgi:hypothetical protein
MTISIKRRRYVLHNTRNGFFIPTEPADELKFVCRPLGDVSTFGGYGSRAARRRIEPRNGRLSARQAFRGIIVYVRKVLWSLRRSTVSACAIKSNRLTQ